MKKTALLFLLLLTPRWAQAWSPAGHLVIAEIAYQRLSPEARAEADRLIAVLAEQEPKVSDFQRASNWMDLFRERDFKHNHPWHYINLPYNADGLPSVAAARPDNAVWAINESRATLASAKAGDFLRAEALRYLLHIVGDLHQPLHAVSRYSVELPEGDQGGNLWKLANEDGDLHWFWDNGAGWLPRINIHDTTEWKKTVPALAAALTTELPQEAFPERGQTDPMVWARESFKLAVEVVYRGIEPNQTPSPEYLAVAHPHVKRRLVLAGYRLADLLEGAL